LLEHSATVVMTDREKADPSLRSKAFRILETAGENDRTSRIVDICLVTLISLSVIAVVLESIDSLAVRYEAIFYWLEVITVAVFTVEYLVRFWCCVESSGPNSRETGKLQRRIRFIFSFHAIIDLCAILPFYLLMLGTFGSTDMRFLRAIRLLRVLKLTRYSAALDVLVTTIVENGRALGAAFFVLLTVMLIAASGMHIFERSAQPEDFGSIPASMWWAFATLTTVGYGDVTPITVGGKVFGALITVVGIGMVALPTGILASGYSQQLRLRSDQYKEKADRALDDGVITDEELSDLEDFRLELGIGKHTASQLLDAKMVSRVLSQDRSSCCPHCGK